MVSHKFCFHFFVETNEYYISVSQQILFENSKKNPHPTDRRLFIANIDVFAHLYPAL